MSRNIIYIINPISGTKKKKDLHLLIEEKTKEQNIPFKIFPSQVNGDYSNLLTVIKDEKITDVVIAGGDGTVNQVINSLKDSEVKFGIIPCGSGNGLAFAAKIPKQPEKALAVVFNGKPVITDGFYLNESFACTLCGLGFDAKVAHEFAQQPKRGLMTYIKQVLKKFFSAKSYSFDITLKEQTLSVEAYFISIANSNQFGNNFTIAPKASLNDGLLDIVIVTNQNKLSFIIQTLKQITGNNKLQYGLINKKKNSIIYFQIDKLSIHNKSAAPLHIDGDPALSSEKIEVKIRKNCFWLYQT